VGHFGKKRSDQYYLAKKKTGDEMKKAKNHSGRWVKEFCWSGKHVTQSAKENRARRFSKRENGTGYYAQMIRKDLVREKTQRTKGMTKKNFFRKTASWENATRFRGGYMEHRFKKVSKGSFGPRVEKRSKEGTPKGLVGVAAAQNPKLKENRGGRELRGMPRHEKAIRKTGKPGKLPGKLQKGCEGEASGSLEGGGGGGFKREEKK